MNPITLAVGMVVAIVGIVAGIKACVAPSEARTQASTTPNAEFYRLWPDMPGDPMHIGVHTLPNGTQCVILRRGAGVSIDCEFKPKESK
jgi:hypothetical protein